MTNYPKKINGKTSKQVYRPVEASAHGSTGDVSGSAKHNRCTEIEFVDPEEEIVWHGNSSLQATCVASNKNPLIFEEAQNVANLSPNHNELNWVPSTAQHPNEAPRRYAVLRNLLENRSNKPRKPGDCSCNISNLDASKGSKKYSTKKKHTSRRRDHVGGLEDGYKFVVKTSVPTEKLNEVKKTNFADFSYVYNVQHESSNSDQAKVRRQGARQRNSFLFWIARQGIEEGEITVSQPFLSPEHLKTVDLGQTEVGVISVSNNGKRLVNLESVRLLYAKPKDSFHLTLHSDAVQTLTEQTLINSSSSSLHGPYSLLPGSTLAFQLACTATVVGYHKAVLLFDLGRHKVLRYVNLLAEDDIARALSVSEPYSWGTGKKFQTRGRLVSGPPPPRPHFAKPLGAYPIPRDIERSLMKERMLPIFLQELSFESYCEYFSALICAEELQWKADICAYDLQNVTMSLDKPGLLALRVPGLLERRPSVIYRDSILVRPVESDKKYQGYVYEVRAELVLLKFHASFHKNFIANQQYDVRFSYSRITIRRCLQAICASKNLDRNFLFPVFIPPAINGHGKNFVPVNRLLNEEQKQSVMEILKKAGGPPYLVYGPPGTGKTVTIVEGILQALKLKTNSKVLACAPSNAAADVLLERLRGHIQVMDMLRINAYSRPLDDVAPELWPYCYSDGSFFCCPSMEKLSKYKVVVSTYFSAAMLEAQGLEPGHFSHIFLDECGQGLEPEALVALANFVTENTVVVLAGDHQQLGPIIRSPIAKKFGLGVSLLERLSSRPLYSRSSERRNVGEFNRAVVTKLVRNYRSHPAILDLPSRLFYDGELIASAPQEICNSLCGWEELPNKNFPVLFVGIEGKDEREGKSPSWFNAQEASKVVDLVVKLKECRRNRLSDDDIGIISPYNRQVKKIKVALALKNITGIKTGSVEQFQGQERKVIIISTVRSSQEFIQSDQLHQIGFLDNPKRFNVAVTRAKALLIVVGNPYVLFQDRQWGELLSYCVTNNSYIGCTPPMEHKMEAKELNDCVDLLFVATQNTGNEEGAEPNASAFETAWPDPTS